MAGNSPINRGLLPKEQLTSLFLTQGQSSSFKWVNNTFLADILKKGKECFKVNGRIIDLGGVYTPKRLSYLFRHPVNAQHSLTMHL